MSMIRTFIALPISEKQRQAIQRMTKEVRSSPSEGVRWVGPENWHITFVFLGDVPDQTIPEICDRVAEVAEKHDPFDWSTAGVGCFPDLRRPNVLWVGAADPSGSLQRIHADLEATLAETGYRPEHRPFRPHITIGRVVRGGSPGPEVTDWLQKESVDKGCTATASSIHVMASDFGTNASTRYSTLARCSLGSVDNNG